MNVLFWLLSGFCLLIIELCTMGLTTIWFFPGTMISAILAGLKIPIIVQIISFIIISIILLLLVKPFASQFINNRISKTNIDAIIEQKAIVLKKINNIKETGQVKVNGMTWTARSLNDSELYDVNDIVIVKKIEGVKLIVKKEEKEKDKCQ